MGGAVGLDHADQVLRAGGFGAGLVTGNGIQALHRECAGGGPEDSIGVNKVEWVTPSGPRRRRRLQSLRRRRRAGNANGIASGKNIGRAVSRVC
jgi:hypothetical protein